MAKMSRGSIRLLWMVSAAALVLSACSKSSTPSYGGGSSPTAAQGGSVTIGTSSVSGVGTVLVDAKGFTLYDLPSEANGTITCTGSCAANWPPVLLPAGVMSATPGSGVSASKLGTIARPDGGTQVTYNGLPLYLFINDQSPGQANGQGVEGFHVVTPSGSGSSGGGGGYGGGYGK
jgi:predicted lipoprotein with Yx(FWY)xxD motif